MKETNFHFINEIYPTKEFLRLKFNFDIITVFFMKMKLIIWNS